VSSTRDLIRELVRLGVGMEVKGGRPALTLPEGWAARRKARAAAEGRLEDIRANAAEVVALWPEVAAEVAGEPAVQVCGECRALVFSEEQGRSLWLTCCEYLFCPYRRDRQARRFQYPPPEDGKPTWQERLEVSRRAKELADDPTRCDPIPE
jgi:hypothetical protein